MEALHHLHRPGLDPGLDAAAEVGVAEQRVTDPLQPLGHPAHHLRVRALEVGQQGPAQGPGRVVGEPRHDRAARAAPP